MTPEQRNQRVYHHLYETCEGIAQQTERIVKLEELVAGLYRFADHECQQRESCEGCPMFDGQYDELCGLTAAYRSIKELEVPL